MTPADHHRSVAGDFTLLVEDASPGSWDDPAPPDGWLARDVVRHLVEWFPGFLSSGAGVELPGGPSVDEDPAGAWIAQASAVQALLDDPATEALLLSTPHTGELPLPQAIDTFYTADVFMHTWDLAVATGQPVDLDAATCERMLAGMEPIDELLRASGQYGPRVEVPAGASAQDRLMGFIGRDPGRWTGR